MRSGAAGAAAQRGTQDCRPPGPDPQHRRRERRCGQQIAQREPIGGANDDQYGAFQRRVEPQPQHRNDDGEGDFPGTAETGQPTRAGGGPQPPAHAHHRDAGEQDEGKPGGEHRPSLSARPLAPTGRAGREGAAAQPRPEHRATPGRFLVLSTRAGWTRSGARGSGVCLVLPPAVANGRYHPGSSTWDSG